MSTSIPTDITKISAPLIAFCGDTSLSVYLADRFFRDGSAHYNIEFVDDNVDLSPPLFKKSDKNGREFIMKDSWYLKHSHLRPALCLFCVSIDIVKIAENRVAWIESIKDQFAKIEGYFASSSPAYISLFVCSGNRDGLNQSPIHEDALIRDLNSIVKDHFHSYLFFEEELIGSATGNIKSMKAEVYQICHYYYSSRLDILDSDMCSSESSVPPRRVIRMMLKMSFFNECLSSLNLQDSNAIYAYTRCLEYYTRVQEFCLSLFADMVEKNHEEIRQIFSIVNNKIILYSILIQNIKGLAQTYKKITACIHAVSVILADDSSALMSLWKAEQYQFLINQYDEFIASDSISNEIIELMHGCYTMRTTYLREAYIRSLETSLCSQLMPSEVVVVTKLSQTLYLQFSLYDDDESYCEARMRQIDFRKLYLDSMSFCRSQNLKESYSSSDVDLLDEILQLKDTEAFYIKLTVLEEKVTVLFERSLPSLEVDYLLVLAHSSFCFHEVGHLLFSILLLQQSNIPLSHKTRSILFQYTSQSILDVSPTDQPTVLPLRWRALTDRVTSQEEETIKIILVLENSFASAITIRSIKIITDSSQQTVDNLSNNESIEPNAVRAISFSVCADKGMSHPAFQINIAQFGSKYMSLHPNLCTLSNVRHTMTYWDISQLHVVTPTSNLLLNLPISEDLVIGKENMFELSYFCYTDQPIHIRGYCDILALEKVIHFEGFSAMDAMITKSDHFTVVVDLRDKMWFSFVDQKSSLKLSLTTDEDIGIPDSVFYSLPLTITKPFSCEVHVLPRQNSYSTEVCDTVYSVYSFCVEIQITNLSRQNLIITGMNLIDDMGIVERKEIISTDEIGSNNSILTSSSPQLIIKDATCKWRYSVVLKMVCSNKKIKVGVISVNYRLGNCTEDSIYEIGIPEVNVLPPPIVLRTEFSGTLSKGNPTTITLIIRNTTNSTESIHIKVKRNQAQWIAAGVLSCEKILLPNEELRHNAVIIPVCAGAVRLKCMCVLMKRIELPIEDFFEVPFVFVQDNGCLLSFTH